MGLRRNDVLEVLRLAEVEYPSHDGRRISIHRNLAIVWTDRLVITILLHTTERYVRLDAEPATHNRPCHPDVDLTSLASA